MIEIPRPVSWCEVFERAFDQWPEEASDTRDIKKRTELLWFFMSMEDKKRFIQAFPEASDWFDDHGFAK